MPKRTDIRSILILGPGRSSSDKPAGSILRRTACKDDPEGYR
jgi:hypothetical protein